MTTNPRPGDRSEDGAARAFLWRLRARLVTPPPETQVRSDLDRLLVVAREQAHTDPSAHASADPGAVPDGGTPEYPVVAPGLAAGPAGEPIRHGDELGRRRLAAVSRQLSRAVAAGVAVLVVGVGASSAANGPVTIQALFGRDAAPAPNVDALGDPADAGLDQHVDQDSVLAAPDDAVDGGDVAAGNGADDAQVPGPGTEGEVPTHGADDAAADVADDASGDQAPSDAASGRDAAGDDVADAGSQARDDSAGTDSGSSGTSGSSDARGDGANSSGGAGDSGSAGNSGDTPSGDSGSSGSTGPSDGDSPPDAPEELPGEEVIAAPPPTGSLDGFGSGARCQDDLVDDCIDDGTAGGPVIEDPAEAAEAAEVLANRRFNPQD